MIGDWIAETGGEPMQWGVNDCALWAASAWEHMTGFDPAASLRGTYATSFACRRVVINRGGMANVCRDLMQGQTEGEGDGIGVVKTSGGQVLACVFSGDDAWVKARNGIGRQVEYDVIKRWVW